MPAASRHASGGRRPAERSPGPIDPADAASQFSASGRIVDVRPHGSGNVHQTFLVSRTDGPPFLLQCLNTRVFPRPDLVMANLRAVTEHVRARLASAPPEGDGRWEVPDVLATRRGSELWNDADGRVWRALRFVEASHSCGAVGSEGQAREVGRALGRFHALTADLAAQGLVDTLPGFHVTPLYLNRYDEALARGRPRSSPELVRCLSFVAAERSRAAVLEEAWQRGRLRRRVIHGDPKVDNVLFDDATGRAVALVDLDTVKPGLLHYDLGDCLRSACNPSGEETADWEGVRFDPDLCRALLTGYLGAAGDSLTADDRALVVDAARLIAFELGLRFLTDHLEGDVYFRVERPSHNLARALVQFRVAESIEAQEETLRGLVRNLAE